MTAAPWVCFSHGQESGPAGTKINALSAVAHAAGWQVESIDYRGVDDPHERVAMLEAWCSSIDAPYVLAGSSMGGHVAAAAAVGAGAAAGGLFLMAPAFYMPGYEAFTPAAPACPTLLVHGWHDDVIPWHNSARFAARGNCELLLLADGHRLDGVLPRLEQTFATFLSDLPFT
jgi:pimeloyl-ACP methyl ester carboxylesterase